MKLVHLILKIRLIQQTSLLKQFLINYDRRISMKFYVLLSFTSELFSSLILSVGSYHFFLHNFSLNYRFYIFFLIILGIFKGLINYRKTHVFPFEEFRKLSPKSVKSTSKILLLADIIYQFLFSSTVFWMLILFSLISLSKIWQKLILLPVMFLIYLSFYYLSNRLMGAYAYHKQGRKIGLLQLFTYLLSSAFWFLLGKAIIVFIYANIYFSLCKHINRLEDFLNKEVSHQCAKEILDFYINGIKHFVCEFASIMNQINIQSLLFGLFILVFLVILAFFLPIHFLPTNKNIFITNKYDFCNIYTHILYCFVKKCAHHMLLKNNLLTLKSKRWLFANNFFENCFITYESWVYFGVGTTIIFLIKNDPISQAQVLIWMNLLMMGNQSYQVRDNLYPYFSFSIERKQFSLIRSMPNGLEKLFMQKLWIFRMLFTSSTIVWIGLNVFFFCSTNLNLIYFLQVLLVIVLGFYIYPLIQMYMVPLATKIDFNNEAEIGKSKDEVIILEKFQKIPRKILIRVITWVTISFLFIGNSWKRILLPMEVLYLLIATFLISYICQKILVKGLVKINELK
ncbi:MAG: hypothetical protein LBS28_00860 [Streptococcaceae bacterium]|jgi:hypothetical protein|nr:hypothetical protein [Streptococcaceae bacterium]